MFGNNSAIKSFAADFQGVSSTAAYQRLNTWKKGLSSGKEEGTLKSRMPAYGDEIDKLVLADFHAARSAGVSVDDECLRRYLVVHLVAAGKQGLLLEEGGNIPTGLHGQKGFTRAKILFLECALPKCEKFPKTSRKRNASI